MAVAAAAGLAAAAVGGCGGSDEPATTSTASTDNAPAKVTELRRRLESELRSVLGDREQAKLVDVDCVIDRLRETLDESALKVAEQAAADGQEIPKQAVDAAFEAGADCAKG